MTEHSLTQGGTSEFPHSCLHPVNSKNGSEIYIRNYLTLPKRKRNDEEGGGEKRTRADEKRGARVLMKVAMKDKPCFRTSPSSRSQGVLQAIPWVRVSFCFNQIREWKGMANVMIYKYGLLVKIGWRGSNPLTRKDPMGVKMEPKELSW